MSSPAVAIVMPAYNAARHLSETLGRIPASFWPSVRDVWVVDDGSRDDTRHTLTCLQQQYRALRSIHFDRNRGYGAAVKAGLMAAAATGVDAVACVHADGQYAPELLPRMVAHLCRGRLDLLQGSRHAERTARAGGMPEYKILAGRALTLLENRAFRLRMTDYHSGYLVYSRRAVQTLPLAQLSDSFDFDLEVIACCRAAGLRIGEQPIPTRYADEVSHLRPVRYGLRVLRVLLRYREGVYHRHWRRQLAAARGRMG